MSNENEIQIIVEYLSTYNPKIECPDNMKTDKDVFIFTQWFSLINIPFQIDIKNPIFLNQFGKYIGIGEMNNENNENENNIIVQQSKKQNKEWRKSQTWYKNGKHTECENYQRNIIEKITKEKCIKTNYRINTITKEMKIEKQPMKNGDGFEWTEDFDGFIQCKNNKFYFNLKFICDKGGSQTRSLREVYHFIQNQLDNNNKNIYFVNILDGDESYRSMDKFHYLVNKNEYIEIKNKIFVGDMYDFQKWWKENNF